MILIDKTNEFLTNSDKALLLLLADGGAGKSLFVQWLTTNLLEQKPPYNEIKSPNNGKPYFPFYVTLSNLKNPHKIFAEGLNLTKQSIDELQQTHQVLLILDGFDEQSYQWKNLYSENKLYNYPGLKVIVTSRINALPSIYSEYFVARQQDGKDLGYQELYLQPFQADQIDIYVANYVDQNRAIIQQQVEQQQIPQQWLDPQYVQGQINSIPGLKELMQTPLLCRLVLIALPQLSQSTSKTQGKITRAQVYEAFMRQWVVTQIITKQHKLLDQISDEEISQALAFAQTMALTMYQDNRSAQLNVGVATFSFDITTGKYQENPSKYQWFEQTKDKITLLPLQESQAGAYKFVHLSMQEYLFASCLAHQLIQSDSFTNLTLNQFKLTIEVKDRPILYFLGDMATSSNQFAGKLFALIEQTRTDESQGTAGANAISALNASEVSLTGRDLSKTNIPNADLSGAILMGSSFKGANLPQLNLQGANLNQTNFAQAQLRDLYLGQYPMFKLGGEIHSLSYSPDGRKIAIAFAIPPSVNKLAIFDINTLKEVKSFALHNDKIMSISYSPDGKFLATGSWDKTIQILDVENLEIVNTLEHNSWVESISYSPDSKFLAAATLDNTVYIWNVSNGKLHKICDGHKRLVSSVSFSPDGEFIASGSEDKTIRIWSVENGKSVKVIEAHLKAIKCVSYSPDGKFLATGSEDGTTKIWSVANWQLITTLGNSTVKINSVSFSPDSKFLVTVGSDKTGRVWSVTDWQLVKVLEGHRESITSIAFSKGGDSVTTASYDKTVRVWPLDATNPLKLHRGHRDNITCGSVSLDGKFLATGSLDKKILIYNIEKGQIVNILEGHTQEVASMVFSHNGNIIAVGGNDKTIRIWNVANGELVKVLDGHTGGIHGIEFSPDDRFLVTGSTDKSIKIWDVSN